MTAKFSNFAEGTLVAPLEAAATTVYLDEIGAAFLPSLGGSDTCILTIFDGVQDPEILVVTAIDDTAVTVVRGQESTTARDWAAGARWAHSPTAAVIQQIYNFDAALTSYHADNTTNSGNDYTFDIGSGVALPALSDGLEISFHPNADNTGATRVRLTNGVDTSSYADVKTIDGAALRGGEFVTGLYGVLRYDESDVCFRMIHQPGYVGGGKSLNDGPVRGFSNYLSNGRFDLWTAATSFSSPASGTEVADGWVVTHDGSIGTFSISRQAFTLGQTDVPGEPAYFLRWDHTVAGSGSTLRRLRQRVASVRRLADGRVTASVWLKADSARTVTLSLHQHFGTGGAPSADVQVATTNCSVTTSWQRFTLTGTAASISGKTLGSGGDDAFEFRLGLPLNTTMTIDVAQGQLERGPYATQFEDFTSPGYGAQLLRVTSLSALGAKLLQALLLVDGAGSGLDADLLDGKNIGTSGNTVPLLDGANTWSGAQGFAAGATFERASGSVLSTWSNTTTTHDLLAQFQSSGTLWTLTPAPSASPDTAKDFGYDFSNSRWFFDTVPYVGSNVMWHAGNDGAGSGLDADTLDGNQDTAYVHIGGTETITGQKTFRNSVPINPTSLGYLSFTIDQSGVGGVHAQFASNNNTGVNIRSVTNHPLVFLTNNTIRGQFSEIGQLALVPLASASTPEFTFTTDLDTGVRRAAADTLALTTGATDRLTVSTTAITAALPVLVPNGSISVPSIGPSADTDTFLYFNGTNAIGFVAGGTRRAYVDPNIFNFDIPVNTIFGSAGAPSFTFAGDTDSGLYRVGADNVGAAAGGVAIFDWNTTRVNFDKDVVLEDAAPTSALSAGFRGCPTITVNSTVTIGSAHSGKALLHDETNARTWTIDSNANDPVPVGTVVVLDNTGNSGGAPGAITLAITSDTLRRGDGAAGTGSRTIAANAIAVIRKTKSTEWVITGTFT